MTRFKLTWAVARLAAIGFGVAVPFAGWTAQSQAVAQTDPQAREPVPVDDDTITETIPEPSAAHAVPGADIDEANAPQPVNLVSETDEEARRAGVGEIPIQRNTLTQLQRSRFASEVLTVLGVTAVSIQEIEAVEVSQVQRVAVTLNGNARVLELYPHSLRSENFRVVVEDAPGVSHDVLPPPVRTYRGGVMDDVTSQVAASVIDGKVHAIIRGRDGAWVVEPVAEKINGSPADLHAVFRISDVAAHNGTCGVDAGIRAVTAQINANDLQGTSSQLGTGGRTQIAFDCDNEYYVANGSSIERTINDVELIMNQVGLIYLGEFSPDICYVNEGVKVRVFNPDPYFSTDSDTILCEFVDEWEANPPFSAFDVAHLMTGKDMDGTTIGIAFVGVVCGDTNFTNCDGPAQPLNFGLSQTFFSNNLAARTALTAHELGHNFNACHCNQTTCVGAGNPADADCGIMWSFASPQQSTLQFGSRSTTSMNNHRNSRTCLDGCTGTTYVNGNDFFPPWSGTLGNPFRLLTNGIDGVRVGGTVRIFGGNYGGSRTIRKFLNLERQSGTVNIGE